MKRLLDLTLGIVTSIGGFLEAGSIITAVQAGALFGYELLWAVALGTFGLMLLVEQSGRLACVSGTNKATAVLGMSFGGVLSAAVLIVAALVFLPRGIQVDRYEQAGLLLPPVLGHSGFVLFLASLGIACFGATTEITLAMAYLLAQGLGWDWSDNARPRDNTRFSLTYTVTILLAGLVMAVGVDPLKLTTSR